MLEKLKMKRTPRVTLLEVLLFSMVVIILAGMVTANVISDMTTQTVNEFDSDIDFRSRNFHKLIRRDLLLASSMESGIDSLRAVEVRGDTLIIRFSILDSVRYFLNGTDVYREDVPVANDVLSFVVIQDGTIINVTLDVAAQYVHRWVNGGEVYHRQYEWVTVLNESQVN